MRKLFTLLAFVFIGQWAFCQTIDEVVNYYKDKGAEYVEMPKALLTLSLAEVEDGATKEMMRRIDCMKILSLEKADEDTRKEFLQRVRPLEGKYKKMIEETEDGETNMILYQGEDDDISSFVIVSVSQESCDLVVLEGHLKKSDIDVFQNMSSE